VKNENSCDKTNYIIFFDFCKSLAIIEHMINLARLKTFAQKFLPKRALGVYHLALALFAALYYGNPSRRLKVIGITGTNGKSTTAIMAAKILKEAGYKVALSSSIEFEIGDKLWKNNSRMTMPGRFALQKFLRRAADAECRYAVIEISSEGIAQHRHRFIDFELAVITNVTPEHIESHGSFEKYRAAKGKLFESCKKIHVINGDDANFDFFAKFAAKNKYIYAIGGSNQNAVGNKRIFARNATPLAGGVSFEVEETQFKLRLPGEFNVYNALAAICATRSQGVNLGVCRAALEKIRIVPGRMERVIAEPFEVFIDYAVTPDSLEKCYQALKSGLEGKLICVLGACGGGRDKWKRPVMGNLAKKYCDMVVLANEDPYDEDPMAIINQIACESESGIKKIEDRREAIREALKSARRGDRVVITGKGCEDSMCVAGGKKIKWNDKTAVLEEMEKMESD